MNLTVLGAGAWGTALAISAARHNPGVCLWARDPEQVAAMAAARSNTRYLPDAAFPPDLQLTSDLGAAVAHAQTAGGLIVIGTPMAALDGMLRSLPADVPVLWLCKGFEKGTGRLGHEVAQAIRPEGRYGILSGPSFAEEVAHAAPTALVAAANHPALCEQAVAAFHSDSLRVYTSTDPIGVEVGGAVKNVLAIATGLCDGLQLGLNARAALVTRGLAEMSRLGLALGARADAAIDNAANLVPRLANALPLSRHEPNPRSVLDRIYKFAAQPSVLPSVPQPVGAANRDAAYSPLWDVIMVHWQPGRTVRELRSVDEVLAAEDAGDVRLQPLDLVVNCPVLQVGRQALPGVTPLPLP